jgi:hypothetical protein
MKQPVCAMCGRPLTSPASIAAGVGRVCAGRSRKGKRHQGPAMIVGGGHSYSNGAHGHGSVHAGYVGAQTVETSAAQEDDLPPRWQAR